MIGRGGGWVKWVKGVKGSKFPVINNSWDVIYNMGTVTNYTIVHIQVLLRIDLKTSHHKKKMCNYV